MFLTLLSEILAPKLIPADFTAPEVFAAGFFHSLSQMLKYGFMQRAFIIGIAVAAVLPLLGMTVVLRRQSMIGDALAHNSLAGVALGMIMGFDPLIGAMIACVIASLAIKSIAERMGRHKEAAIVIVLSVGIGLASLLSDLAPRGNFHSYLFGSIVAVSETELLVTAITCGLAAVMYIYFYDELFLISYSKRRAKLCGVPVKLADLAFTLMTAVTISVASRTVGALIVSSFMVIPVVSAMEIGKSYKGTMLIAVGLSELFTCIGLTISWQFDRKPGGTFVLLASAFYVSLLAIKSIGRRKSAKTA